MGTPAAITHLPLASRLNKAGPHGNQQEQRDAGQRLRGKRTAWTRIARTPAVGRRPVRARWSWALLA